MLSKKALYRILFGAFFINFTQANLFHLKSIIMKIDKDYIENLREDYSKGVLEEITVLPDPMKQFEKWFSEAIETQCHEPNAMTLATATPKGIPSARTVLLKGLDERGFVFYTNYNSKKGEEIRENNHVSLLFFWPELARQVRIDGMAEKLSKVETQEYFNKRPHGSKLGAMSSNQSKIIETRDIIETRYSELEEQFANQEFIEVPDFWGGFLVVPYRIEFWQGRSNRLHDRLQFTLQRLNPREWKMERLAP
jgi:pyridoxamine 5'-phosphate oxidase